MALDPIKVFISYAHEDSDYQEKIAKHLRIAEVDVWVDREIDPGQQWNDEIGRELDAADIILLLISDDFLSSDFVRRHEIPRALERHRDGTATVVPVLVRDVEWSHLPIGQLQAIPEDEKWITGPAWPSLDAAARQVARSVRRLVEERAEALNQRLEASRQAEDAYRRAVAEALVPDGLISDIERLNLEDAREQLGLSVEVAREIEAGELQPIEEKRRNIAKYEQAVAIAMEKGGHPLDATWREELKKRQAKLGLQDEDLLGVEERVAARLEAERAAERTTTAELDVPAPSAAASIALPPGAEDPEPSPTAPVTVGETEQVVLGEPLKALLDGRAGMMGLHVAPAIPDKKLRNASNRCAIPEDETVVGLIDTTVFGSAKTALVFGQSKLYFFDGMLGHGPRSLSYEALAALDLSKDGYEVIFDDGLRFNTAGGPPIDAILDLLRELQEMIVRVTGS